MGLWGFFQRRKYVKQLKSPHYDKRGVAADMLGDHPKAVPALIEALEDEHPQVRWKTAGALGRIADRSAVPKLIELLDDGESEVRNKVIFALGEIGDSRAFGPLVNVMTMGERPRARVVTALVMIVSMSEMDLSEVRTLLKEVVDKEPENRELFKQLAAEVYTKIAATVSERKKKDLPGELLPPRIKKPKKRIYRQRRAVNG